MDAEARELLAELVAIDSVNPRLVPGRRRRGRDRPLRRRLARARARRSRSTRGCRRRAGRTWSARARGDGGGRTLLLYAHMDIVGVDGMTDPFRAARRGRPALRPRRLRHEGRPRRAHGRLPRRGRARRRRRRDRGRRLRRGARLPRRPGGRRPGAGRRRHRHRADRRRDDLASPTRASPGTRSRSRGRAAHGSRPQEGVDAIASMGHVLAGLDRLAAELGAGRRTRCSAPARSTPPSSRAARELSTYPDALPPPARAPHAARRARRSGRGRAHGHARRLIDAEPRSTQRTAARPRAVRGRPQDAPIVRAARRRARPDTPVIGVPYWADAPSSPRAGIPTVIFGPGGAGAHAAVEWVDLRSARPLRGRARCRHRRVLLLISVPGRLRLVDPLAERLGGSLRRPDADDARARLERHVRPASPPDPARTRPCPARPRSARRRS